MKHLLHPCFIRVHRWLRIKGICFHLRSSADSKNRATDGHGWNTDHRIILLY